MPMFRKNPIVTIEANRWHKNGDHPEDAPLRPFEDTGVIPTKMREGLVVRYFRHPDVDGWSACKHCGTIMHEHGWIDTRGGGHTVCPGDWIVTGQTGEHYPCKPDIFDKTYALATDVRKV